MKVIRGLPLPKPSPIVHAKYNFENLRHGDAIIVSNAASCQEMFRRWRRRNNMTRNDARLIDGGLTEDGEYILFFMTDPINQVIRARVEDEGTEEI